MKDDVKKISIGCVTAIVLVVLIVLLTTLPIYWLWNWLMPVIFGLPVITLWQALGLNFLCSLLFKTTASSKN